MSSLYNVLSEVADEWWVQQRGDLIYNMMTRVDQWMETHNVSRTQPMAPPPVSEMGMGGSIDNEVPPQHPHYYTSTTDGSMNMSVMDILHMSFGGGFGQIVDMFPQVPILPTPDSETHLVEMMANPDRRRNFFSRFTLPESLEWRMIADGSIQVECQMESNGDECSICLEELLVGHSYFSLTCGHHFHSKCLCRVLCTHETPRCPLCRETIGFE